MPNGLFLNRCSPHHPNAGAHPLIAAASSIKVLPRRWVVERTFGWLMGQRRLVRDYETTETSAEAWIFIAMIRIQLRRLA